MIISDVLFSLKNLVFSVFREPSLLWQFAPLILLWFILILYFATHKQEKLGWNTSLANGISLFWVVVSAMQHVFSNNKQFFTWAKFIVLGLITLYALFIIYMSFKHALSAKMAYLFASHNIIFYFSLIALLYAYDMIYLSWSMGIAIVILFLVILLFIEILTKLLPELKEDDPIESEESEFADFDSSPTSSFNPSEPGGIETTMGDQNLSENPTKW